VQRNNIIYCNRVCDIGITSCRISIIVVFACVDLLAATSIEANKPEKFLTISAGCIDKAGTKIL